MTTQKIFGGKGTYVVTYSGVSTIGRNSYMVIKDGRILVIDFGVGFPELGVLGAQYILPDLEWIKRHRKRIDGIVITHAHLDHVGGIGFLLQAINREIPLIGSRFTVEFAKEKLKEFKLKHPPVFKIVNTGDTVKVGSFIVDFARVTHSIPQSMAVAVNTAFGKVVYTGDFKLDPTPINEMPTDVSTLKKWARQGVLVALLDSTNAFEKGYAQSETSIMRVLEDIIRDAKGRVIIGMFSSLVSRLIGILEIAKKLNKKVAFTGKSLETNVKIAMRIGYLTPDQDTIISIKDVSKYDDRQVIIISTGSQGEYQAALTKMARSKHEYIKIKSTDTIILSSSVIPTNVLEVQRLMDLLAHTGATIINSKLMDVHVSGHAYQEDMKDMAKFLSAEYYVPVHGYPSFLFQHKRVLEEAGVPSNKVFIPTEGAVLQLSDHKITPMRKLRLTPQYVVGGKVLGRTDTLIEERLNLAQFGSVLIILKRSKRSLADIKILQKGAFSAGQWPQVQKELRTYLTKHLKAFKKQYMRAADKKLKRNIMQQAARYLFKEYKVKPSVSVITV